jgi:hypothetical protein
MIQLNLSCEEQEMLKELLEVQLSELRMEICGTDRLEFRDHLRTRKAVLLKVIDALAA